MADDIDTVKTAEDVAKLSRALALERADHKATKTMLRAADATIAERFTLGDNPTAASIATHVSNVVKATVAQQTGDLLKRNTELESALAVSSAATVSVQAELNNRSIAEEVRAAAAVSHVKASAINDLVSLANLELQLRDGIVQSADGATVTDWLDAKKSVSGYMWPVAQGSSRPQLH